MHPPASASVHAAKSGRGCQRKTALCSRLCSPGQSRGTTDLPRRCRTQATRPGSNVILCQGQFEHHVGVGVITVMEEDVHRTKLLE